MSKRDSFTCILIKDICDFEEGKEGKVLIPRGTIFRQCSSEGPGQGIVLIPVKDGHISLWDSYVKPIENEMGNGWISTEIGNPDIRDDYLVRIVTPVDKDHEDLISFKVLDYCPGAGWDEIEAGGRITHWQPLFGLSEDKEYADF